MTGWRMLSGLVALLGLLWSTPGRAQAMPLRECRGELPPPWVTSGKMTEQVCFQTVLHAAGGYLPQGFNWKTSPEDSDDRLTAARGPRGIIAIRDWQPFSSQQMPDSGLLDFSGATVLESGETGEPGELWWGRVATGSYRCCANANIQVFSLNTDPLHKVNQSESLMLAVGQESSLREQASFRSLAQLQAYDQGRLPPWPAKARSLRYEQLAATAVTAQGSNPVAPGTVSSARVELTSLNPLQGNLQFTLAIGGLTGPLTIPMKRDVDESRFDPRLPLGTGHPFRLRQGRVSAGAGGSGTVVDCYFPSKSKSPTLDSSCHDQDPLNPPNTYANQDPQYSAQGIFYGAEAQYLALVFDMLPLSPDPARSKTKWGQFYGLIILKRSSVGY